MADLGDEAPSPGAETQMPESEVLENLSLSSQPHVGDTSEVASDTQESSLSHMPYGIANRQEMASTLAFEQPKNINPQLPHTLANDTLGVGGPVIGKGGIFSVSRSTWSGIPVVCKQSRRALKAFNNLEISLMNDLKLLCMYSHPCLAQVYGIVKEDSGSTMVIEELAQSGNAELAVRAYPAWKRLPWLTQIASALSYMHSTEPPMAHGAVHPRNVLLRTSTQAILSDGCFHRVRSLATEGYSLFRRYRAPELLASAGISQPQTCQSCLSADVYAFGCLIHFVITGNPLFHDCSEDECLARQLQGELPDIDSDLIDKRGISRSLLTIMRDCLQLDTSKRPSMSHVLLQVSKAVETSSACISRQLLQDTGAPERFCDPITMDIMQDPVVASDGFVYDRQTVERWLVNKNTSPLHLGQLESKKLYSLNPLKSEIKDWEQAGKPKRVVQIENGSISGRLDDSSFSDSSVQQEADIRDEHALLDQHSAAQLVESKKRAETAETELTREKRAKKDLEKDIDHLKQRVNALVIRQSISDFVPRNEVYGLADQQLDQSTSSAEESTSEHFVEFTSMSHGGTLDLEGRTVSLLGGVVMSADNLTIKNCLIKTSGSIELRGVNITFHRCDIECSSESKSKAALHVLSAGCKLENCNIQSAKSPALRIGSRDDASGEAANASLTCTATRLTSQEAEVVCLKGGSKFTISHGEIWGSARKQGLMVEDRGSLATLSNCKLFDCRYSIICAIDGGSVNLDKCDVWGAQSLAAVSAEGQGSNICMENVRIHHTSQACCRALNGGRLEGRNCDISWSFSRQGIVASGEGSYVDFELCKVHHTKQAGVWVDHGAKIRLSHCEIYKSINKQGVMVERSNSEAVLDHCKIHGCECSAVCALGGGRISLASCDVSKTRTLPCVSSEGTGSAVICKQTRVHDTSQACCRALSGGMLHCVDTEICRSVERQGVVSSGKDSFAKLERCTIHSTKQACTWADNGSRLELEHCEVYGSKSKQGVTLEHAGTHAVVSHSKIHDCECSAICTMHGAVATIKDTDVFAVRTLPSVSSEGVDSHIEMFNCKVHDSQSALVRSLNSGSVSLTDCDIWGSADRQGVICEKVGSKVTVTRTSIKDCKCSALCCLLGGLVEIKESHLSSSETLPCLSTEGEGSIIRMWESSVFDSSQSCVRALNGGFLEAFDCKIYKSLQRQCIVASGDKTRVALHDCHVHSSKHICVWGDRGASIDLLNCKIHGSESKQCVVAERPGSKVGLNGCEVWDSHSSAICAINGGNIVVDVCKVWGVQSEKLPAISAEGSDSVAVLRDSEVKDSFSALVRAMKAGKVHLERCNLHKSKGMQILVCNGAGSNIEAQSCRLYDSFKAVILSEYGGRILLQACVVSGSQTRQGVMADGMGSLVDAVDTEISNCKCSLVCCQSSARTKLEGCKLSGAGELPALSSEGQSKIVAKKCLIVDNPHAPAARVMTDSVLQLIDCTLRNNLSNSVGQVQMSGCDCQVSEGSPTPQGAMEADSHTRANDSLHANRSSPDAVVGSGQLASTHISEEGVEEQQNSDSAAKLR